MKRPRMSTGAWIFATAVTVAAITAPSVYAAATSTVAIGNPSNGQTALVDTAHQLVTVDGAQPREVINGGVVMGAGTDTIYVPPSGKAVVLTSVTYSVYAGTEGTTTYVYLLNSATNDHYDTFFTTHAADTQAHTFPTGLPMPTVTAQSTGPLDVRYTGYLIPASQLPAASAAPRSNRTELPGVKPARTNTHH